MEDDNEKNSDNIKKSVNSKQESENKVLEQKISDTLAISISTMFAVLIGVTFFMFFEELVPLKHDFQAVIIITAYVTVLADMIGYLRTINIRPYRNLKRFILDLILIYLFFQLLYSFMAGFEFFLIMNVIIFSFYLVWTIFEYTEFKQDKTFRKTIKTSVVRKIICIVLLLSILIFYTGFVTEKVAHPEYVTEKVAHPGYDEASNIEWILLLLVLTIVIGNKIVSSLQHEFLREPDITENTPN